MILLKTSTDMQQLQERYELAINGTHDGLWDWDLLSNTIYFSPRWKSMLGYEEEELENSLLTWKERVHPDDLAQAIADIQMSQNDPDFTYNNIHRLRHKDGRWVWILDRGQTIFDEEQNAVRMVGFHTDITELKELQEQLLASTKELKAKNEMMIAQSRHAQMGEMISMIAHQWRQPLSVIAMSVNNLLVDVALGNLEERGLCETLNEITALTNHLSKTIDDFRNFFKPDKEQKCISLESVFLSAYSVIQKSFENENIALEKDFEAVSEIVAFDRELQQVFINILKNAQEALVANRVESRLVKVSIYETQEHVVIEICDNAGGVAQEHLAHLFEPYFSTKDEKNGTGLGLYMSKMIVEKHHNGELHAKNQGSGSCFVVALPREKALC